MGPFPAALRAYLWHHRLFSLVVAYINFACLLRIFTAVDIGIPCLWKSLSGISCPGCGLTSAYISCLKLDLAAAWHANPLIFIVAPAATGILLTDFRAFVRMRSPLLDPPNR